MGSPDEIEARIAQQRRVIREKFYGLKERVGRDVDTMKSEAKQRAAAPVKEALGEVDLDELLREYPMAAMVGGLGLGVVLGITSEGVHMPRVDMPDVPSVDGRSLFSGLSSLVGGVVTETVQAQLREFFRQDRKR